MIIAALASTVTRDAIKVLVKVDVDWSTSPGGQQGQEHVRFWRLQGELSMKSISTPLVSRTENIF